MFPLFGTCCWNPADQSPRAHRERKLQWLKWWRDELETRLAGLNAAITTIERQMEQERNTPPS